MNLRPVDSGGDILPVFSVSELTSGAEAVGRMIEYRLNLLTGDWWENPALGCPVLEWIRNGRRTEYEHQELANLLTEFIRETPGVTEIGEVRTEIRDRRLSFSCTLRTAYGETGISTEFSLG